MSMKTRPLTAQEMADVIGTALYGGINYWAHLVSVEDTPEGPVVLVVDREDPLLGEWRIDLEAIRRGWALLPQECINAYYGEINVFDDGDIDIDAGGADTIVQYGIFGKLVYG